MSGSFRSSNWADMAVPLGAGSVGPVGGDDRSGCRPAHPLGNFTVNRYSRLELASGQVRVFYVLDMAEIPAFQAIQELDRDGDTQVSPDEGAAFAIARMGELRQKPQLTLSGTSVDLKPVGAPELSFPPGQGGLSLLRLIFWLEGSLPTTGRGLSPPSIVTTTTANASAGARSSCEVRTACRCSIRASRIRTKATSFAPIHRTCSPAR